MSSTSFGQGNENSGTQVGVNQGSITQIFAPTDRAEILSQNIDNDVLESLAFDHMLDRKDNIERCHENTCKWILELEEYRSWQSQYCGLLWIKGKPGAGKSTLMAFLYDKLQTSQEEIRLEFFFTARGAELQHTPLGMLRSLLNQIFNYDPTVRPQIREAYARRCKQFGFGKRTWEWPRVILEDLLSSAIMASASQQRVIVFVDALDEAGAQSAQQLATYFHRLIDQARKKNLSLQIYISCRHYPIMENGRATSINVEDHNTDDIATYIQDTLLNDAASDDLDAWSSRNVDLRLILVEKLTEQANGVFQWVHITLPLVEKMIRDMESYDDISCWLREVPTDLEEVYTYILMNVIEKRNREESFLFFQWMCLAERPLTVTEIRYALVAPKAQMGLSSERWEQIQGFIRSNEHMAQRLKVLSGGLAEVVPSGDGTRNETVQVVHQSVNDFLRTKGLRVLRQGISIIPLSFNDGKFLSQCQATLYRACLACLTSINIPAEIRGLRGPIEWKDDTFVHYATINLFIHAEKATDSRSGLLDNEWGILERVLGSWVRIYQGIDWILSSCPAQGTTVLHMAAAANLVDLITSAPPTAGHIARRNISGDTAFHMAARWGHVPAGKILLDKGADQMAENHSGETPLFKAASGGHIEFVQWLLSQGVNLQENSDVGALSAACMQGNRNIVEILLGAGMDVNAQGGQYGTALQAAVCCGRTEIVQMLVDANADVNSQGGVYGTALHAAIYRGGTEIVQILLSNHADVNAQPEGDEYNSTALQAAAHCARIEILQILLDANADVNSQGGVYGTALQAAVCRGSVEMVQILLSNHADVNAKGGEYDTALQAAAHCASIEIVQILLDANADVNAQGGEYGTALQAAVCRGSIEIVQILLSNHADVNAKGGEYDTALQAAAHCASIEIVQILLDANADVNPQGGWYGTALQAAADCGSVEIVQLLLSSHVDVNAQGGEYGTALQAAASLGSVEIVQLLLDANAHPGTQGGKYGNSLQAAAYCGSIEIVQILLDSHVNVNAQGGKYGTALQAAASCGLVKIVQILLDAHANPNAQGGKYGSALQAAVYFGSSGLGRIVRVPEHYVESDRYDTALQAPGYHASIEIIQMLLGAHADINADGGKYGNSLQIAAWAGSASMVQELLRSHADVHAKGGRYGTALYAAAYRGMSGIVQILLDAHADVNARVEGGQSGTTPQAIAITYPENIDRTIEMNYDGSPAEIEDRGSEYGTALQAAASANPESTETVQILLDAKANVNAQGGRYGSALHAAAWSGNTETVHMLLSAHADVNAQGGRFGRPLLAAVHRGDISAVQALLHAGADELLTDELGQTALHIAASGNMLQLISRFPQLTSRALINHRDLLFQSPLHLAVYFGHVEFALALLALGADPSLRDGYGRNVMDWVTNHESMTQEIRKRSPQLILTAPDTQESTIRRSLSELSHSLSLSKPQSSWPILQHLGRAFMFLGQLNNAQYIFQVHLLENDLHTRDVWPIACNLCKDNIRGPRFICKVFPHTDLCSSCVQRYPFHSQLHPNQEHEILEVSNSLDKNSQFTGPMPEGLKSFLAKAIPKHFGHYDDRLVMKKTQDAIFSAASEKLATIWKTPFSLVTVTSALLVVVSSSFIAVWYFLV